MGAKEAVGVLEHLNTRILKIHREFPGITEEDPIISNVIAGIIIDINDGKDAEGSVSTLFAQIKSFLESDNRITEKTKNEILLIVESVKTQLRRAAA